MMLAARCGATRRRSRTWAKTLPAGEHGVVVYCVHGHEVSQNAAKALRAAARSAVSGGRHRGGLERERRHAGPQAGGRHHALGDARAAQDRPHRLPVADRALRRPGRRVPLRADEGGARAARARGAIPYDVPDVHFSHDGDLCSFDAFIKHYRLAAIRRSTGSRSSCAARTPAKLDLAPQAPGLAAISLGLSRNFADDHEMLKHGMVMYDALYTWCKEGQDEVHTWNPEAYR